MNENQKKKSRIVEILELIKEKPTLKKLKARIALNYGFSDRKVKEYLTQLSDAEYIEFEHQNNSNEILVRLANE